MSNKPIIIKTGNSISVAGMLGVLFVGLKLTNIIDWSWWWVTCPFWIGAAVICAVTFGAFIVAGIGIGIAYLIDYFQNRIKIKKTRKRQNTDKELYDMLKKHNYKDNMNGNDDEWNT